MSVFYIEFRREKKGPYSMTGVQNFRNLVTVTDRVKWGKCRQRYFFQMKLFNTLLFQMEIAKRIT